MAWKVTDPNSTVLEVDFVVGPTNCLLMKVHLDMMTVVVDHLALGSHPFAIVVVHDSMVVVAVGEVAVENCLFENPMD